MTLNDLSLKFGYGKTCFSTIKCSNPEKWEKMISFDCDIEKSIVLYEKWTDNIYSSIQKLASYCDNSSSFARVLKKYGVVGKNTTVHNGIYFTNNTLFSIKSGISKDIRVLKKLEKFKKKLTMTLEIIGASRLVKSELSVEQIVKVEDYLSELDISSNAEYSAVIHNDEELLFQTKKVIKKDDIDRILEFLSE